MRYLAILLCAFVLSACDGSGNNDHGTEYTTLETETPSIHVETGLSLPQPGAFDSAYQEVASCTGIAATPPNLYLVSRPVTQESYAGVGIALDTNNGRLLMEGIRPSDDTEPDSLLAAAKHLFVHYLIWQSDELDHRTIGHNHDFFLNCAGGSWVTPLMD